MAVTNPNTIPRRKTPPPIGPNRSSATSTRRRARTSPERATTPDNMPCPTKIETARNIEAMCRNFQKVAASTDRIVSTRLGRGTRRSKRSRRRADADAHLDLALPGSSVRFRQSHTLVEAR
jgi:hypothetical protein